MSVRSNQAASFLLSKLHSTRALQHAAGISLGGLEPPSLPQLSPSIRGPPSERYGPGTQNEMALLHLDPPFCPGLDQADGTVNCHLTLQRLGRGGASAFDWV
ncbi:hypothetical protein KIL84_016562 [Mauremys mutica]|uniref:Uncharacterized protein n=1 Tax=Mauremys mutica TaxID=74926 RepID=A0A9D4AVZ5_9SAUR|nr:hypothetical protein KIL84_016562 [Mauremys mutica]